MPNDTKALTPRSLYMRKLRERYWAENVAILQREEAMVPELVAVKTTRWRYRLTYNGVTVDAWPSTNAVRLRDTGKLTYMPMKKLLGWLYDTADANGSEK